MINQLFRSLLILCFLCFTIGLQAQDVMVYKNGDKKEVKIVEINDVQIKYYEMNDINGLLFTEDRAKLREIIFESGTKTREGENPYLDENYYIDDRKNNLKINFLAIGNGTTILTYERSLNPYSSYEIDLRINGMGIKHFDEPSGVGIGVGYKLKLKSIFNGRDGYRPNHLLHGGYFRPRLMYNYTSYGNKNSWYSDVSFVSFGFDVGKQWTIQNIMTLDLYAGIHYYGGTFNTREDEEDYWFYGDEVSGGDMWGTNNRAGTFGFRVGFMLP